MTAVNVVRMRVKPGQEEDFLAFHRDRSLEALAGMKGFRIIRTGERDFCLIGEWPGMDALAAARPGLIGVLDQIRDQLEDLGGGLGVTDPASGEVIVERTA